jgi:hypothetical protein
MSHDVTVKDPKTGRKKILFEITKPGVFRAKAERAGMSTKRFAGAVLANPENYQKETRRQAASAKGLMAMGKD